MVKIEFKNITYIQNKKKILDNISFVVHNSEYVTIVGATGSGKTSLIAILSGLYQPTSGKILFDGNDVTKLPPNERHCGFMFESYALFPHLSILDNVSYSRHMQNLNQVETYTIAHELLNLVRINDRDFAYPRELSGGMQQRVALARALMAMESSGLLILDEPFKALDAGLRRKLRQEVRNIAKSRELRLTTIHVTNDMNEAMMGDRILVIHEGKLHQFDDPDTILHCPIDLVVANFFSTELTYFNGKIIRFEPVSLEKINFRVGPVQKVIIQSQEGYFLYAKTEKPYQIGDEVTFLIRSHHWKIRRGRREDKTNSIVGHVKRVKFMGFWLRLEIEVPYKLEQLLPENSKDTPIALKNGDQKEAPEKLIKVEIPTTRINETNYQVGEIVTVFYNSEYVMTFPRISDVELENVLKAH